MDALEFKERLRLLGSKDNIPNIERFFFDKNTGTQFLGVPFRDTFALAKEFIDLPLFEVDILLEDHHYEVRMGAVSIMDYQTKSKKISELRRKEIFDLYLFRHDRINNWDLVDRGSPSIIGEYLLNRPRQIIYDLATSDNVWERRTGIVSTHAFIKKGQLEDTFKIAGILINDKHEMIHKAVGSWIREAGKHAPAQLFDFLEKYVSVMPRITLSYATEKMEADKKNYFRHLK